MSNHGTDPRRRLSLMRERVEAMKAIWTEDEAEYHGEQVDFDPIWCWPKPVQQPHPPVLLGGSGPKVLDRVLSYADEWTPNNFGTPEQLKERIDELRERAGRHVRVVCSGVKPERELVSRLEEVGADGCTFYVSSDADLGEAERQLDEFAALG
jgi:alkanesulfonate monooxygenase SsuD/methylene tetrahydromethanopterin reductase-like flavin-dependent oxidoreductase (luciferase family)